MCTARNLMRFQTPFLPTVSEIAPLPRKTLCIQFWGDKIKECRDAYVKNAGSVSRMVWYWSKTMLVLKIPKILQKKLASFARGQPICA